ncbi:hypothetical protein [Endozoicomonas acroporae]|uniref:hypothetical protein n=1 Tax=Endozoicomonas acroporae TaxID=1701104 RepID=UPI0013D21E71|nr:hypothetical protein [Endozoicomonas acroporae]
MNSRVETEDKDADAGIGGGDVADGGTVANTMAVNSTVGTSGNGANAGIGAGIVGYRGTVANTTAVNSWVNATGSSANAGIGAGIVGYRGTEANTAAENSYVNGQIKNQGNISDHQLSTLCQEADLRVLTDDCSSRTEFLVALDFSYSDACPVNSATATRASIPINTLQPIKVTNAETTINVSGLPGATMTLPTTVASSAAILSTGAVAGIALGAAAFVVAGVVARRYIYRRYCRGSSAADVPQEMVAINTVGQAYEEIETRNLRRIRTAVK